VPILVPTLRSGGGKHLASYLLKSQLCVASGEVNVAHCGRQALVPRNVHQREWVHGIAHINAQAMLWADAQTYSHRADFCWMDENRKYQTDWHLFEKRNYVFSK
jgi:hypothetical protein